MFHSVISLQRMCRDGAENVPKNPKTKRRSLTTSPFCFELILRCLNGRQLFFHRFFNLYQLRAVIVFRVAVRANFRRRLKSKIPSRPRLFQRDGFRFGQGVAKIAMKMFHTLNINRNR